MSEHSTEMNHRDFSLKASGAPPETYPTQYMLDRFTTAPDDSDFASRRRDFLSFCARNPASPNFKSPFFELARLATGQVVHAGIFLGAMDFIDQRNDCADFILHGLLRLEFQFPGHPNLPQEIFERNRRTILNFKYWPDEPGIDSLCTWTENHQILYASAAYLAGQKYPEAIFTNSGQTGREKMASSRPRILRWLNLRFRTGFSEWLSNVYYDEDLTALISVVDFCADHEIARRAAMLADLLLLDLALHNFKGVFAATHGRSYENSKKYAAQEATSDIQKLVLGVGILGSLDNMSAVSLALSPHYSPPEVISAIARDQGRPETLIRQRMGICLAEAERWGLAFDDYEDGMVYLSLEAYNHPRAINLTFRMFDAFNWWENLYFAPFKKNMRLVQAVRRLGLMPHVARLFEWDINRNNREEANLYTYRTPDFQLSSAQDYRKGCGGDQHSIWQATLGPDAVCFTTHPAKRSGNSPDYWVGSGTLPRTAQMKNVLVALYDIDTRPGIYHTNRLLFTHAWLPQAAFDETREERGWIFARKGDGYLALYPRNGFTWVGETDPSRLDEVISEGKQNIWICELGRKAVDGEFSRFQERILAAPLKFKGLSLVYGSPSQGEIRFGLNSPLMVNGSPVQLDDYPRFDSPYVQAEFDPSRITVACGVHRLELDWPAEKRNISQV